MKETNSRNADRSAKPSAGRRITRRRAQALPLFMFGSACAAVFALAAWSAVHNPALAALMSPAPVSAPMHARSFAQAPIAKPTYTATALSVEAPATQTLPSATAEEFAAEILPPAEIVAEIVEDTPMPAQDDSDSDKAVPASDDVIVASYRGTQYILVDITDQHLYAYDNDLIVYSFVASTGMNNATSTGTFSVLDKIPSAYGSTWDIWMPDWLGIYWAGGLENGIHALPILSNGATLWAGFLGRPISYGCVVLGTYEAELLYDWAEIGTTVEIQW
jgi:lipoprotein-anchoring transpeptidase ErfK/SrfK